MQENYDPKHELNLHRKQYGNLKRCVQLPATKAVLEIHGHAFRFLPEIKITEANEKGFLTPKAFQTYLEGRKIYLQNHLNLYKKNN